MKVFFDLETSSKYPTTAETIEIGAVTENGDEFNRYINPVGRIDPDATRYHDIGQRDGRLTFKGEIIQSGVGTPEKTLKAFINFLRDANDGAPVTLVAYNGNRFDFKILRNNLMRFDVDDGGVIGSLQDAMVLAKACPDFKDIKPKTQVNLLNHFTGQTPRPSPGKPNKGINDAKDLKDLYAGIEGKIDRGNAFVQKSISKF